MQDLQGVVHDGGLLEGELGAARADVDEGGGGGSGGGKRGG